MLLRKVLVIGLSAVLALPVAGQEISTEESSRLYQPIGFSALLKPVQAPEPGQAAPAPMQEPAPAAKPEPAGEIRIEVLDGEGGQNDIQTGAAVPPKVQVMDQKGPVPGAEVVFTTPMAGASATFNGWVRTQTLRTGDDGIAAASGYEPNQVGGRFSIQVTATAGSQKATAMISQTNISDDAAPRSSRKKWIILGIAAGAAIGIIAAVAAGGDDDAAAVPVTISAGSIGVGAP